MVSNFRSKRFVKCKFADDSEKANFNWNYTIQTIKHSQINRVVQWSTYFSSIDHIIYFKVKCDTF